MKLRIIPYKLGSQSAKELAEKLSQLLGYKVWRARVPKEGGVNLLWGYAGETAGRIIQPRQAVLIARNKHKTFVKLKEANVLIPPFTTSKSEAAGWVQKGNTVLARTVGGQGGSGIDICTTLPLPNKPLYVMYVKKRKEFRVHVFCGSVIDVQEKRRKNGIEVDNLIRNHENGWVFCHENIVEPSGLREAAIRAIAACGLDFGAVDIIWNEAQNRCYVLEINTAPGLSPTTTENYARAIQAKLG